MPSYSIGYRALLQVIVHLRYMMIRAKRVSCFGRIAHKLAPPNIHVYLMRDAPVILPLI